MEIELKNGRYRADPRGGLATVSGPEETAQRILMKLTARRGGFSPWPDYGSRLHTLCSLPPSERPGAARQFVAEALSGESGAAVEDVTVGEAGDGELSLELTLRLSGGSLRLNIVE